MLWALPYPCDIGTLAKALHSLWKTVCMAVSFWGQGQLFGFDGRILGLEENALKLFFFLTFKNFTSLNVGN